MFGACPEKCLNSQSSTHLYWEYLACDSAVYSNLDMGSPPTPNYAVYVNWAGGQNQNDCDTSGGSWYFPFRIGTWTSQPKGTGRLNQSWGFPQAALERIYLHGRSPENIGLTWFGLNHSGQVAAGYGLHLYTHATSTWSLWNQAATECCYATFPPGQPNSLVYLERRQWDAFQVND
jgi:hypothetical protein